MTDIPTPANLVPYVRALGVDGTVRLLLEFGGANLNLPQNPGGRSALEKLFGREKVLELGRALDFERRRLPTAKPWIACQLAAKGLPKQQIARMLHSTDVAVRRWIAQGGDTAPSDPRQLRLI